METKPNEQDKLKAENAKLQKDFQEQKIKASILQNTVWKLLEQIEEMKKGRK